MKLALCSSFLLAACQMTPQQGEALGNLGAAIMSSGSPYGPYNAPQRYPAVLQREVVSGSTKICIYSRAGTTETLPIAFTNICPYQLP